MVNDITLLKFGMALIQMKSRLEQLEKDRETFINNPDRVASIDSSINELDYQIKRVTSNIIEYVESSARMMKNGK